MASGLGCGFRFRFRFNFGFRFGFGFRFEFRVTYPAGNHMENMETSTDMETLTTYVMSCTEMKIVEVIT